MVGTVNRCLRKGQYFKGNLIIFRLAEECTKNYEVPFCSSFPLALYELEIKGLAWAEYGAQREPGWQTPCMVLPLWPHQDGGRKERLAQWAARRRRLLPVLGVQQGWKCFYCRIQGDEQTDGEGKTWHLDHKHPELRGTDLEEADIVLACELCNVRKGPLPAEEFILLPKDHWL